MTTETAVQARTPSALIPMTIVGILFFVFGFVTWLNGALIPFLQIVSELNEFQALFVTFAFYIAYTVMALPAALVLRRTGYKSGMVIGLGVMVVGSLVFIPAAQSSHYAVFLLALFILGTGLTLLQTAANPYIVCIGPRESAAMRMSIMGLLNKGAGVVAPVVFTLWVLTGMDQFDEDVLLALSSEERAARLAELSNRLVVPYLYMAGALLALMLFVHFSSLPELNVDAEHEDEVGDKLGILNHPQAILGSIALFMYVGVEVIAGDTIGLYGRRMDVPHFGSLTAYTMTFMVIGYLIGVACIPRFLSQAKALAGSALFGGLFTLGVLFGSTESHWIATVLFGWLGWMGIPTVPDTVMFLALLGMANALCWPAIWPLALEDLGKYTSVGSALLVMGIAGGALIPLLYGYFAETIGNQVAYWIMLPCYLYILFYALKGHKMRRWKS